MAKTQALISTEFRTIRTSFRNLARSFSRLAPFLGKGAIAMAAVQEDTRRLRKKPRISAANRAALKLQGKNMGTMRGLPAAKRVRVKRIRAEKGIRAAVAAARRMGG